jgi:hypothetical protein
LSPSKQKNSASPYASVSPFPSSKSAGDPDVDNFVENIQNQCGLDDNIPDSTEKACKKFELNDFLSISSVRQENRKVSGDGDVDTVPTFESDAGIAPIAIVDIYTR